MIKQWFSKGLAVGILGAGSLVLSSNVMAGGFGAPAVCPAGNVVHYDKVVFRLRPWVANLCGGLPAGEQLDVNVLDSPSEIADLKGKVIGKLWELTPCDSTTLPDDSETRGAIKIIDVEYAIVCASGGIME